ncbi:MAG: hypothetical protein D6730_15765 [Bacteroidetes bacterium]|nr:MAG: hypothetical protein D6730_15765 [Bacteroidota bacterium]
MIPLRDFRFAPACILLPVTCILLPVTCYLSPATCILLPVTCILPLLQRLLPGIQQPLHLYMHRRFIHIYSEIIAHQVQQIQAVEVIDVHLIGAYHFLHLRCLQGLLQLMPDAVIGQPLQQDTRLIHKVKQIVKQGQAVLGQLPIIYI